MQKTHRYKQKQAIKKTIKKQTHLGLIGGVGRVFVAFCREKVRNKEKRKQTTRQYKNRNKIPKTA